MALKFLNKKGWHTGSLRNIENVWKAEQKHEAEQKKLDELRKQIQEERERSEFRQLQEQAGLVPRQERLDFLYDSGLAVGRSDGAGTGSASGTASGSGFNALEQPSSASAPSASKQQSAVPGALFEDKPYSASDSWRKLHSDPLLLIRQREQEALARVKNNPVKMALIRKSVEEKKGKEKKKHKYKSGDKKERKKKHRSSPKHSSRGQHSESEYDISSEEERPRKTKNCNSSRHEDRHPNRQTDSRDELSKRSHYKKDTYKHSENREQSEPKTRESGGRDFMKRYNDRSRHEYYPSEDRSTNYDADRKSCYSSTAAGNRSDSLYRRHHVAPKLSEEERADRLREMQANAELHEEQRWKRLKKAEEDDAREATQEGIRRGKNFLDAAQKSVYGAEKGGSSTIEERVRRRTYYSQGREASEGHAFRR